MREIKFRAKQINDNNWISGYGVIIGNGFCAIPYTIRGNTYDWKLISITCDINTLGQYTGLKDKNGKEIFEGDIIFSNKCDGRAILHKVEYNEENAMFVAKPIQGIDFDFCQIHQSWIDKYGKEVIGNIYDNPELI